MNKVLQITSNYFDSLFNTTVARKIELILLRLAVVTFVLHLLLIYLSNHFSFFQQFQHSYLKAIYTPFSFILFYEVFLLIIIIPNSISEFIGKQFEVITLITLRSFFHDIADVDLHTVINLQTPALLSLLYDLGAALAMLALIITTILLRMSLTMEKPMNYFMVIVGFLFSIIAFFLYKFRQINYKTNH